MTIETARRKLRQAILDARAQQAQHKRTWGDCTSECEQVQRESWMTEALDLIGGRVPA